MATQNILEKCDALILNTLEAYEPEAIVGLRDWLGERCCPVYAVGPLFPIADADERKSVSRQEFSVNHTEVETSLDRALQIYGEKSLVYVSFGSLFWSKEPEKIFAFIDVLLEKTISFIMSYASPFATIPDAISERVDTSGIGLLTKWSPQQTILTHPATAWFVTHCGHNSVMEAIGLGVPLICWPFHSDQAPGAAHLTTNLDVAYELFEVRTGTSGLKPIHRLDNKAPVGTLESLRVEAIDVLDKAFGDDGIKKRANVKRLQEKILKSWSNGGSSRRDMEALVNALIDAPRA